VDGRGVAQHGATLFTGRRLTRYEREARPSKLDPYKHYIDDRVKAESPDWIPATLLLRELRALGYPGGYSILKNHLQRCDPWPSRSC
jgi:transposase